MKILQVPRRFTQKAWGGTETVVLETSRRLIGLGHQTRVVCPNALDAIPEEEIGGVPVTRHPYFYPYFGLSASSRAQLDRKGGNLFSVSLFRDLMADPGVDVLHAHTGKRLGGLVRTAARLRGLPYIVSLHGGAYDVPGQEAASWTEPARGSFEWGRALGLLVGARRVLQDADAVLCLGEQEKRLVEREHPGVRAVVLPNGVAPDRFATGDALRFRMTLGIAPEDELLLVAGRIDAQKNQALALEVLAALASDRPRLRLVFMGPVTSPAYRDALAGRAHDLGLAGRIRFFEAAPASNDLVDAYHAADLVLVPSIHEPFGIVVLEAWAAGKPVLASRVGGLVDLVEDGVDGRLLPPADRTAWVSAVGVALQTHDSVRKMGLAGRHKATARYSWDAVTGKLVALYESVRERRAGQNAPARGGSDERRPAMRPASVDIPES